MDCFINEHLALLTNQTNWRRVELLDGCHSEGLSIHSLLLIQVWTEGASTSVFPAASSSSSRADTEASPGAEPGEMSRRPEPVDSFKACKIVQSNVSPQLQCSQQNNIKVKNTLKYSLLKIQQQNTTWNKMNIFFIRMRHLLPSLKCCRVLIGTPRAVMSSFRI